MYVITFTDGIKYTHFPFYQTISSRLSSLHLIHDAQFRRMDWKGPTMTFNVRDSSDIVLWQSEENK